MDEPVGFGQNVLADLDDRLRVKTIPYPKQGSLLLKMRKKLYLRSFPFHVEVHFLHDFYSKVPFNPGLSRFSAFKTDGSSSFSDSFFSP